MKPRLLRSGLTDRVYVVTRYRERGNGIVEATTKHDVTDEFNALAAPQPDARPTGDTARPRKATRAERFSGPFAATREEAIATLERRNALSSPATPPALDVEALALAERMERMFVTGQAGGDVASVASILRHFAREFAAIKGDAS